MNNCNEKFVDCWSKRTRCDGNLSTNDFKCIKKLDKGAFGYIYLARFSEKNSLCVLKITNQEELIRKKVHLFALRERNILQCCEHPNIVRCISIFKVENEFADIFIFNLVFASFKDESNIYLVLEFINGGRQRIQMNSQYFLLFEAIFLL